MTDTLQFKLIVCRPMFHLFLVSITALVAAGCFGGSSGPKPYGVVGEKVQVNGVVSLDGQSIADATVTFSFEGTPPKGFVSAGGVTDSSGKYQARSGNELGIPPGRYKVAINKWATSDGKPFKENPEAGMDLAQAKLAGQVKEMIPEKYSDIEKTEITVEITKDQKEPVSFELKSK